MTGGHAHDIDATSMPMTTSADTTPADTTSAGDGRLRQLLDKDDIRELIHRYCHAVDRLDRALVESVFHPDAVEDHGHFTGQCRGYASLDYVRQALDRSAAVYAMTQHVIGNIRIDLQGDTAFTEAYVTAYHRLKDRPALWILGARYVDRFERRDGRWGVARRTLVKDWGDLCPIDDPGGRGFRLQRRDRWDPSYERWEAFPADTALREAV